MILSPAPEPIASSLLRQAQSASDIKFEEGQSTEHYASELVQLLQQSLHSTESLARMPLVEYLKQQADGLSSSADLYTAVIWQLTGTSMRICIGCMARPSNSKRLFPCLTFMYTPPFLQASLCTVTHARPLTAA